MREEGKLGWVRKLCNFKFRTRDRAKKTSNSEIDDHDEDDMIDQVKEESKKSS